ncbi:hypothetical protein [Micropruina sp.]|uniref:hypothetical protein n=1 Tax=Micropruina sp. TaxID=2737536 RepID=UPI0039E39E77
MTDWTSQYAVVVASDVSARDGLGWEFTDAEGEGVWAVFREDGGAFPVLSAARGPGTLPARGQLEEMTSTATSDLLAGVGLEDPVGWITSNITAALLLASIEVESWEGEEWALESSSDDQAAAWATNDEPRIPFAWLRARQADRDSLITVYQDDAVFGLSFTNSDWCPLLPPSDTGSLRSRRDVPLTRGRINQVEVVYDITVEGCLAPGLVTEVLLHGDTASTLLIAAEAYSRDEWHLYDESVVALPDPAQADTLAWIPTRTIWRPTEGRRP